MSAITYFHSSCKGKGIKPYRQMLGFRSRKIEGKNPSDRQWREYYQIRARWHAVHPIPEGHAVKGDAQDSMTACGLLWPGCPECGSGHPENGRRVEVPSRMSVCPGCDGPR